MGGGVVLIFFGFLLMWGTAIVPAYAIVRRPLGGLHFILRVFFSIILAFVLALVTAYLVFHWRSKAFLGWYFAVSAVSSVVIVFVLLVRKLAGTSARGAA